MTSLERAKQFLKTKSHKLAAAAAPLAALAMMSMPVKAGPVLTFGSPNCSGSSTNATNVAVDCGGVQTPQLGNGANGLALFGEISGDAVSGSSGSTTYSVALNWFGSTSSGSYAGSLPVDWNFTVTPTDTADGYSWFLHIIVSGGGSLFESGGSTGQQTFTGSDTLNLSGSTFAGYSAELSVSQNTFSGGSLDLFVPGAATVDINTSVVPEPATLALIVPGLGLLFLKRRKKR